ncbi:MAG: ATP-binding protein [Candidatus Lokiarchaeota archaeon]|nr:ATP-binding protein [Candidatus Lokiarchaeota archaeon]
MKRKRIAVISGKGGVGKTSLVASLASIAHKDHDINLIVLDCDVDAPNLALILPPKSEEDVITQDMYTTKKVKFLEEICIQCKQCYDEHFCEFNALNWDENNNFPIIDYLACEGCGACKVLCPESAFEINPVKSGEIISYETSSELPLIYGKTKLGSSTSGLLVSGVKELAKNLKKYNDTNLILIDGPPGIGCPVIATVSGLDYIVAITEPTPSGLHDLKRALEMVNQFNIPFGIVINKADLKSASQKQLNRYIKKSNHEILGRINFDLSIPEAMSYAESVVDYAPESVSSQAINKIYTKLKHILSKI